MANARSPQRQAAKAIRALVSFNSPRHTNKSDGKVHSVGTARQYEQIFKSVATWLNQTGNNRLGRITTELATQYLQTRASDIAQKQLNNERRALELHLRSLHNDPGIKLERLTSDVERIQRARAYTAAQIELVQSAQSERTSLSTRLAQAAGLRAEELLTIRPYSERSPSAHREWSAARYAAREDWARYTVKGKGGLVREVRFPPALAAALEARRLETPRTVTDRGVRQEIAYDLIGGKSFSNVFSREAHKQLGWSEGAHGLRHSYAQTRMDELQQAGYRYREALGIVSQELGHFRPEITEVYLR